VTPSEARRAFATGLVLGLGLSGCGAHDADPGAVEFRVAVGDETFVMRATDPETVRLAVDRLGGRNRRFPIGPLLRGDGGFNAPWSWRLDPAEVRLTEVAVEVCDGTPSYVEAHLEDFAASGYCPWSARIVGVTP
jgi:hypothetical protein